MLGLEPREETGGLCNPVANGGGNVKGLADVVFYRNLEGLSNSGNQCQVGSVFALDFLVHLCFLCSTVNTV